LRPSPPVPPGSCSPPATAVASRRSSGPGRILTAAAGAEDLAYENLQLNRSYLVEYMVRRGMAEGEARGSVEAAFAYAVEALQREHPERVPVQDDRLDGELTFTGPGGQPQPAPPVSEPSAPEGAPAQEGPPPPPQQQPPPPQQQPAPPPPRGGRRRVPRHRPPGRPLLALSRRHLWGRPGVGPPWPRRG
jgi:hypothetical protein